MNKLIIIFKVIIVYIVAVSCECNDCEGDGNYKIKATISYINDTSEDVVSLEGCNKNISPGQTLTFTVEETLGSKPNLNNFPVSIFTNCNMMYKVANNLKCEKGINSIENYERNEVSPLVYKFIFRFTEEKKSKAEICN